MSAEDIDNLFAATFWKINFSTERKTFLGDKDSREVGTFFQDAKGLIVIKWMVNIAFQEAFIRESVINLARRPKGGDENGDGT